MKFIYTLATLASLSLCSCQKEIYFPTEPNQTPINETPVLKPASKFTLVVDGKTYELKVRKQLFSAEGDTATINFEAALPELSIRLVAKSTQHASGVGDYALICCDNDVFEKLSSSTQTHWEGEGGGVPGTTRQEGFIKITKKDDKGYEGTYSLFAKSNATIKEFKGAFTIVF